MIKYVALILVLYVVSFIALSLILDKIFMFDKSKDESKMIFTVMYILVVLILTK